MQPVTQKHGGHGGGGDVAAFRDGASGNRREEHCRQREGHVGMPRGRESSSASPPTDEKPGSWGGAGVRGKRPDRTDPRALGGSGLGQCRSPENGEAHLVIEKMKKVIIKCSFAGSHDEDNGWWPGGPYALG